MEDIITKIQRISFRTKVLIICMLITMIYITELSKTKVKSSGRKYEPGVVKEIIVKESDYIPKVIYKTGIDEYGKVNEVLNTLFNNTLKKNPGFSLEYYSDTGARDFIKNNYNSEVLAAYDKLIPGAYKADLFRYCVLYKRGGIYSDLSQRFQVPLTSIIDFKNDKLVLVQDVKHPNYRGPHINKMSGGIQISFMALRPKNEIYLRAIQEVVNNCKRNYIGWNPLSPTGPRLFQRLLNEYPRDDYKLELRETGKFIVDKQNNIIIINKTNNHRSINLKNKEHYSSLWMRGAIYK